MSSQLNSNDLEVAKKLESTYERQLLRFNCVFGTNLNDPEWNCNQNAPNGWGKFYGKKLQEIKSKKKFSKMKFMQKITN